METETNISMTLEAEDDGTLHIPVPPSFRNGKLRVDVTVVKLEPHFESAAERKANIIALLDQIRASNPFKDIRDPVEWQREIRQDRELPWPE